VGVAIVGDYRCLTLDGAADRVTADSFTVGSVNYTFSGGPVDDTWVVEQQTPEPGTIAAPGSQIDLVLSSPFDICPTPAAAP
jgi:beta-lactam-binding protein with PASTA domain